MPDWPNGTANNVVALTRRLDEAVNYTEILEESLVDLELAAEDRGWLRLGADTSRDLSRAGLQRIAVNCRTMSIASPLVKRALMLRVAYIWGQGLTVAAREDEVNDVVQAFWDDEANKAAFTSSQAQEELERTGLGCDGNIFLALFTMRATGKVIVRSTPFDEVQDIINNPEDRDDPWYYLREWETNRIEPGTLGTTRMRWERRRELHPALGYWPTVRPRSINGIPVNWDAPILHVSVNRLDGAKFGVGDAYAGIPWARAYEGFLTDWAKLMKALAKFAWRLSGDKSSRARQAAEKIRTNLPTDGYRAEAGATAAFGPGMQLEAIPKSGATLDSESGKPLASMVAASMGLPVTMLLGDPGISGARATAETLDTPVVLEMGMRRTLWGDAIKRILSYVIDQAVKAPNGPLRGTISRDEFGREVITLADEVERTVEVDWPKLDDLDPKTLVEAIVAADSTDTLPGEITLKLLLTALGVKDADEILADYTDDEGRLIDPEMTAGNVAKRAFQSGADAAEALRS